MYTTLYIKLKVGEKTILCESFNAYQKVEILKFCNKHLIRKLCAKRSRNMERELRECAGKKKNGKLREGANEGDVGCA